MARSATRRSTEEVKSLLVDVALEAVATGEFDSVTTRQIAERAKVSESVLFRHFGSKANLLATAMAAPFEAFVIEFGDAWTAYTRNSDAQPETIVREFVADLYDNLAARRTTLRLLIAATINDVPATESLHRRLEPVFEALTMIATKSAVQRGVDAARVKADIRIIVAAITALAVLDDWFVPVRPADRERLIDDVSSLFFQGLGGRPAAGVDAVEAPASDGIPR